MNNEQNRAKTNINWYPGHMAKTKRQIMADLKLVDIVIELLDARIPISSQNPDIAEITKNKKKIIKKLQHMKMAVMWNDLKEKKGLLQSKQWAIPDGR